MHEGSGILWLGADMFEAKQTWVKVQALFSNYVWSWASCIPALYFTCLTCTWVQYLQLLQQVTIFSYQDPSPIFFKPGSLGEFSKTMPDT